MKIEYRKCANRNCELLFIFDVDGVDFALGGGNPKCPKCGYLSVRTFKYDFSTIDVEQSREDTSIL